MKKSKLALCAALLTTATAFGVAGSSAMLAPDAVAIQAPTGNSVVFAQSAPDSKWAEYALKEWRGKPRTLKVWPAIEIDSSKSFRAAMKSGESLKVIPGALEVQIDYPGVIEKVSVGDGWRVKKKIGSSGFVLTNAVAFTVKEDQWEEEEVPSVEIVIDGRFWDQSSELTILKGSPKIQIGEDLDRGRVTMN